MVAREISSARGRPRRDRTSWAYCTRLMSDGMWQSLGLVTAISARPSHQALCQVSSATPPPGKFGGERAEQRIDEMGKGPLRVPVTGGVQSYKVHAWVAIALMITACFAWGGRMTWR